MKHLNVNETLQTLAKLGPELQPRYFYWLQKQDKEGIRAIMWALGAQNHDYVIMHGLSKTVNYTDIDHNTPNYYTKYWSGWVWDNAAEEFVDVFSHVIQNSTYITINKINRQNYPDIRYADNNSKEMFMDNKIEFSTATSGLKLEDIPRFDDLLRTAMGFGEWQTPSSQNITIGPTYSSVWSWIDANDAQPLRYKLDGAGSVVRFSGVTSGISTSGDLLFNLPDDYRPKSKIQYFTVLGHSDLNSIVFDVVIEVQVNGNVIIRTHAQAAHHLFWDGCIQL